MKWDDNSKYLSLLEQAHPKNEEQEQWQPCPYTKKQSTSDEITFNKYWDNYGELHAGMCGGDIKQFAKEIWLSVTEKAHAEIEELTKSLGTYYDLNMKLEQQIADMKYKEEFK